MTLDLIRKDFSLKGSSHKIEDKQVPGIWLHINLRLQHLVPIGVDNF